MPREAISNAWCPLTVIKMSHTQQYSNFSAQAYAATIFQGRSGVTGKFRGDARRQEKTFCKHGIRQIVLSNMSRVYCQVTTNQKAVLGGHDFSIMPTYDVLQGHHALLAGIRLPASRA